MEHGKLRGFALRWDGIQQSRLRLNNMLKAFDRTERPYPEPVQDFLKRLRRLEANELRAIADSAEDSTPGIQRAAAFVTATGGLGPAVLCVLGLIPPIDEFPSPAKLWAYLGLAVVDGRALRVPMPPPPNNPRGPAGSHFSRRLRAYATRRIVDPIIKNNALPYILVYRGRRDHTRMTHPEWAEERNKRGEVTPKGHYHADAIRYTAKRIWRDVWNAAHGRQSLLVTQKITATVAAAV